jgi:hypothetical protein
MCGYDGRNTYLHILNRNSKPFIMDFSHLTFQTFTHLAAHVRKWFVTPKHVHCDILEACGLCTNNTVYPLVRQVEKTRRMCVINM